MPNNYPNNLLLIYNNFNNNPFINPYYPVIIPPAFIQLKYPYYNNINELENKILNKLINKAFFNLIFYFFN